jgi:cellulose synthase/poly-beta-1,6-N-acetylglucosamine synthase-like glycosyltransferase
MLGWVGWFFAGLTLAGCGFIAVANAALIYQVASYFALRRRGMEEERTRLGHPLPPDAELPHVVLQIPTFNESTVVERSIENAMKLDWPRDKLHVQICDDSTDKTTDIARAAAARAVAQGFDVVVMHRDDRKGFKAGALHAAMAATPHNYFAILDVDYVCPPDFLRRCMAVLLSGPRLAFVQARPDFLNARHNILTRAQTLLLDYHYALEQPVRSWSGQGLPFNGTCGVWRREGIELGGGWRGETLTEDWELSYHARLKGMRGIFVNSVTASGELPTDLQTWMPQQRRWAKGIGQVAWMMLPRVFSTQHLSLNQRIGASFPLVLWFLYSIFTATYLVAVPALLLAPSLRLVVTMYVAYEATFWVVCGIMLAGMRAAGRKTPLWRFVFDVLPVPLLGLYISWAYFWSLPATALGRRGVFVRTPKRGSSAVVP